jgi:hypothetical protein
MTSPACDGDPERTCPSKARDLAKRQRALAAQNAADMEHGDHAQLLKGSTASDEPKHTIGGPLPLPRRDAVGNVPALRAEHTSLLSRNDVMLRARQRPHRGTKVGSHGTPPA